MVHPLDPVLPEEITFTSHILKAQYPGSTLSFRVVDINEPPKAAVLQYIAAERANKPVPFLSRITKALFTKSGSENLFKATVDVTHKKIVKIYECPPGVQGPINPDQIVELEELCMKHPAVQAEVRKLQLPPGYTAVNDPWIYGTDDPLEKRGLVQFYMYVMQHNHPETNHYSLPLKFSPVFDINTRELVRMDYLPGGVDEKITETQVYKVYEGVEYTPELTGLPPRAGLKPYNVSQPEGASFTADGNVVQWQKWRFRVGFNYREGVILYDITFDGRDVIYRISLSEMTVPYGDPRRPYHRKQAFDLGDVGFGACANQLKLGCDCLGYIRYFDGYRADTKGKPVLLSSVICLHEQDNGLLYKHMNYRNEKAIIARRRELIIQTVATVSNYEYVVEYIFDQAAGIDIRVRATGILSTMPIDDGITVPWGTIVGPGVMAAYHQHMLSFRIDPAIDGHKNTLLVQETVPLPQDAALNPYNVGYVTQPQYVERSGSIDQNPMANREFKIINENVINPISKKPVGYKIVMPTAQMLIASPQSFNTKRAIFATKPYWVTKYEDEQLYAGGEFTNQSQAETGLGTWANGVDNVRNEDIVVWPTMGFTHNPRPEDFPVMPVEIHMISLRPNHFFDKNPALDIPQSTQQFNKSVLIPSNTVATGDCCHGSKI